MSIKEALGLRAAPKSVYEVLKSLASNESKVETKEYDTKMIKVKYPRMANRVATVGRTVFRFDANGMCEIPDVGNTSLDVQTLLKMNGVSLVEDKKPMPEAMPKVEMEETPEEQQPDEEASFEVEPQEPQDLGDELFEEEEEEDETE